MIYQVPINTAVRIDVKDGSDAITRVTGDGGDEWRNHAYSLYTEEDVLNHWAYNALHNGVDSVDRLDGWADLEPGDVSLTLLPMSVL